MLVSIEIDSAFL